MARGECVRSGVEQKNVHEIYVHIHTVCVHVITGNQY